VLSLNSVVGIMVVVFLTVIRGFGFIAVLLSDELRISTLMCREL